MITSGNTSPNWTYIHRSMGPYRMDLQILMEVADVIASIIFDNSSWEKCPKTGGKYSFLLGGEPRELRVDFWECDGAAILRNSLQAS